MDGNALMDGGAVSHTAGHKKNVSFRPLTCPSVPERSVVSKEGLEQWAPHGFKVVSSF